MKKSLLLLPLALLLAGCGGHGGDGATDHAVAQAVYLTPTAAALHPGEALTVELSQTGYPGATYALSVVDADGGTLTGAPGVKLDGGGLAELYTAPAKAGTYHVAGTVTDAQGVAHAELLEIKVVDNL